MAIYLSIGVKVLLGHKQLHDRKSVIRHGPVDRETAIIVFGCREFWIGLLSSKGQPLHIYLDSNAGVCGGTYTQERLYRLNCGMLASSVRIQEQIPYACPPELPRVKETWYSDRPWCSSGGGGGGGGGGGRGSSNVTELPWSG